jgi:hypothetical protein
MISVGAESLIDSNDIFNLLLELKWSIVIELLKFKGKRDEG